MNNELLAILAQFGAAGLIAWMWLTERRHSAQRDRQLDESHRRLREQRLQLDQLLSIIAENTRAITALEHTQRRLSRAIERLAAKRERQPTDRDAGAPSVDDSIDDRDAAA